MIRLFKNHEILAKIYCLFKNEFRHKMLFKKSDPYSTIHYETAQKIVLLCVFVVITFLNPSL